MLKIEMTFIQSEADPAIMFTITNAITKEVVDVRLATITLEVKRKFADTETAFIKTDTDFDKTNGEDGIVTTPFSSTNLNQDNSNYIGELSVEFSSSNIAKGQFYFTINEQI